MAREEPDGHSLIVATVGPVATQPHVTDLPYGRDDFEPIMLAWAEPYVLITGSHTGWTSLEDFIQAAKESPGEITYGATPAGGMHHVATAQLEEAAGIDLNTVPYQGSGPALTAMLGGHVDVIVTLPSQFASQMGTGNINALGIFASERSPYLPEVPTMSEQGYELVASWREAHERFWTASVPGITIDDATVVAAERFRLVERLDPDA